MKIGITSTGNNISDLVIQQLNNFISNNTVDEIHQGDCIGVDKIANDISKSLNINVVIHPPANNTHRAYCKLDYILDPKPYIERNHNIVDSTSLLIAVPPTKSELLRSGTWSTVRYANKRGNHVHIIYPDGTFSTNSHLI